MSDFGRPIPPEHIRQAAEEAAKEMKVGVLWCNPGKHQFRVQPQNGPTMPVILEYMERFKTSISKSQLPLSECEVVNRNQALAVEFSL